MLLLSSAPFPAATGASTRLAQRIAAFTEGGYALDILTPKTPELPHVSKLMGARILRVPMPFGKEPVARTATAPPGMVFAQDALAAPATGAKLAAFERAIRRQLASSEYEVVVTTDPFSAPAVLEEKGTARVVYEVPAGLPDPDGDEVLSTELRRRDRELVRGADVVLAPSEELATRAWGLGAARERVHVVRPSVDLELFTPAVGRRRRAVGEPLRVALAAALLSSVEVDLLAEVLARLPAALELQFQLSAALHPMDRARLLTVPLASRILLVEPVLYEDLAPFYQAADLGLIVTAGPEHGDLPPVRLQVLAEMMACALPVVAPDVPAAREIAEDQKHALLAPSQDAMALAAALCRLAGRPTLRRMLGLAARTQARERLDEHRSAALLLSIVGTAAAPSVRVASSAYLEPSWPTASSGRPTTPNMPTKREPTPFAQEPTLSARGRPHLATAAQPDAPTAPDMNIHSRAALADLASAATTDPTGLPVADRDESAAD